MDDRQIRDEAWGLLLALCRSGDEMLQPLPAPGQVVELVARREDGNDAVSHTYCLWGGEGPELLDEAGYGHYVDPSTGAKPGVFVHRFVVTPGWGDLIDFSEASETGFGEWVGVRVEEPDRAWRVRHAFGGLYRDRQFFQGVLHWVHMEGDEVVLDDTDIWFA